MKNITGPVTKITNVSAEAIECTFDSDGVGHIMSILANMYSNKALAVLREYSCNARDSHIEAGQTRPIEITLPTSLQPSLLVKDYGVGLGKAEILSIYATYGKSTKRDTNEQVGAFGIGSKSGFTVGNQFVVTGIKDGWKVVALFALNENNVPTVTILQEVATTEPNGVLVSLAVDEADEIAKEARTFFAHWPKGSVLVDGVEPDRLLDHGGIEYGGSGLLLRSKARDVYNFTNGTFVVMGGVTYPVSNAILHKVADRLRAEAADETLVSFARSQKYTAALYLTVPIGGVDLAPSREALRDTPHTVNNLAESVRKFYDDALAESRTAIEQAANWREAYLAFEQQQEALKEIGLAKGLDKVQWHGVLPRPATIKAGKGVRQIITWGKKGGHRSETYQVNTTSAWFGNGVLLQVDVNTIGKTLVVTDVPEGEEGKISRFARRLFENGSFGGVTRLVLTSNSKGRFDWLIYGTKSSTGWKTFEEVREEITSLAPARAAATTKRETRYDTTAGSPYTDASDRTPLSEILEEGKNIAYFEGYWDGAGRDTYLKGYQPVVLTSTQTVGALERAVLKAGGTITSGNLLQGQYLAEIQSSITEDDIALLAAVKWADREQRYEGWSTTEHDLVQFLDGAYDDIVNDQYLDLVAGRAEVYLFALENKQRAAALEALPVRLDTDQAFNVLEAELSLAAHFPLLKADISRDHRLFGEGANEQDVRIRTHLVAYLNGLAVS